MRRLREVFDASVVKYATFGAFIGFAVWTGCVLIAWLFSWVAEMPAISLAVGGAMASLTLFVLLGAGVGATIGFLRRSPAGKSLLGRIAGVVAGFVGILLSIFVWQSSAVQAGDLTALGLGSGVAACGLLVGWIIYRNPASEQKG